MPQDPNVSARLSKLEQKQKKLEAERQRRIAVSAAKKIEARQTLDLKRKRKTARKELIKTMGKSMGHTVKIVQVPATEREQFRIWAKENRLRTANRMGVEGEMIWNKNWTQFWFKDPGALLMFHFHFKHLIKED